MSSHHVPSDPPSSSSAPSPSLSEGVLERYLAGTCTPAEAAQVMHWAERHPDIWALVDVVRSGMPAEEPVPTFDTDRAWTRIRRQESHGTARRTRVTTTVIGTLATATASVVAFLVYSHAPTTTPHAHTYVTAPGQHTTVQLADGSHVTLAPQTRLDVPSNFGMATREIQLTGEAYFDVMAKAGAPLTVHTGAVATRVLGTKFDIRRYPSDAVVRVVVTAGKVSTGGQRRRIVLSEGSVGYVTDTTATLSRDDVSTYTVWTGGRLVFEDVPASAMLATVGQWYGLTFRLADSTLAAQHVKAIFDVSSRDRTLTAIKALLDVTMQFDGTTVTLRPRQGHRSVVPSTRVTQPDFLSTLNEAGK